MADLQQYLLNQVEWKHNFGLVPDQTGPVIGKMFGTLLVELPDKRIGYLSAYSGKLAGTNVQGRFVPPVYDSLLEGGFLNTGMIALKQLNNEIALLDKENQKSESLTLSSRISVLKEQRKKHSSDLQDKLFDHYHFLNYKKEEKSLRAIFKSYRNIKPPSGAGECAAPKLLQYAFSKDLIPIAIAEFWWGLSPKSDQWKHGHYYPVCKEKCEPILSHMLEGIATEGWPS